MCVFMSREFSRLLRIQYFQNKIMKIALKSFVNFMHDNIILLITSFIYIVINYGIVEHPSRFTLSVYILKTSLSD